jgi:tRNA 2-selenouridine synthase
MPVTLTSLAELAAHRFDAIIDVRAPAEYAEDHLPGAISLPVLDDGERAQVGTIYKQVSPFTARKVGAALVAQNAARHLQGPLADKPGGWRPLVYCWRGGQRSGSFASILAQVGWRVETLAGGYKAWRKRVLEALDTLPPRLTPVLLDGNTGSAKTALLAHLAALGVQVLDLEAMANHRGSLFGAMGAQPGPKAFQTRLAVALAALDPARPVVLEAESAKVGNLTLPHALWQAMTRAPRIALNVPVAERAAYLARAYADVTTDPARLMETLDRLRPYHAADRIADWQAMAGAGAFADLAGALMEHHYDPRYRKHRARMAVPVTDLAATSLAPQDLPALAARIADLIPRLTATGETP